MTRMHPARLISFAILCAALFGCTGVPPAPVSADPRGYERYRDPDIVYKLISEETELYILVDVRTAAEYVNGHIPTAINIPYDTIAQQVPSPDKAVLIIVYCASGRRSAAAKQTLEALGYTRVVDFGAFSQWKWEQNKSPYPGGSFTPAMYIPSWSATPCRCLPASR